MLCWFNSNAQMNREMMKNICEQKLSEHSLNAVGQHPYIGVFVKGEEYFHSSTSVSPDSIFFKAGGFLYLTQAYEILLQEIKSPGFLHQPLAQTDIAEFSAISPKVTFHSLLTHTSSYPRLPWNSESKEVIWDFVNSFPLEKKKTFQLSQLGCSLLEYYCREKNPDYPASVLRKWMPSNGFSTLISTQNAASSLSDSSFSAAKRWPFALFNDSVSLYVTPKAALEFVKYCLFSKDSVLGEMMQPYENMHTKYLKMCYGFQVGLNIKDLPIYMVSAQDRGNSLFIGIVPATQTGIIIMGDTFHKVDKLGIGIMTVIHRDMLKLEP